MTDLYKIMVHDPEDVTWEDDSFAGAWGTYQVDVTKDGDIAEITVQAGYNYGNFNRTGLSIDIDVYSYLIVCLKGDGVFRLAVYQGGSWIYLHDYQTSPSEYEVRIYDVSSVVSGTIDGVRIRVGDQEGKSVWCDFIGFVKRVPQFLEDLMEVKVHQRESDLDEFELFVDSKGPVEDDTVLLIHFDEGLGSKAFDESKYKNHGTLFNGVSWVNGKYGKGISFDGIDDYVNCGNDDSLRPANAVTVMAWIKNEDSSNQELVNYRINGPGPYYIYKIQDNLVAVTLDDGTDSGKGYQVSFSSTLPDEWKHVALVFSRADQELRAYIDGELEGDPTPTGDYPLYNKEPSGQKIIGLFLGAARYDLRNAKCKIDEVYICNRSLSTEEIEQIYRRGLPHRILVHGRHIRVWLNQVKVFAGIIEEVTPEEDEVLHGSGRCFGQKLLLRTKSKTFNNREVSLAVKDLVEDLSEVSTYGVEVPSPTVNITKDFKYEYIVDGLKDLAKQAGSDWEFKLGMGQDLRFRSRSSANVPTSPVTLEEGVNVLRGVRRENDALRLFNKVIVIGSELSNFDNDPDAFTDEGDASSWSMGEAGQSISEDGDNVAYGKKSLKQSSGSYYHNQYAYYDLGSSGRDLTPHKYLKFYHKTDADGVLEQGTFSEWNLQVRLTDIGGREIKKDVLGNKVNPPQNFSEVEIELHTGWTLISGTGDFDWEHVRWIEIGFYSNATLTDGIKANYWFDKLHFYTSNIIMTATDSSIEFAHSREYVLRDEKLVDPEFVQEVADALLQVLKSKENRYFIPVSGSPKIQVGQKVSVDIPSHGLSGTYYIAEVRHKISPRNGSTTEVILERPQLSLETLLSEVIGRRIKRIERGGIA